LLGKKADAETLGAVAFNAGNAGATEGQNRGMFSMDIQFMSLKSKNIMVSTPMVWSSR